MSPLHSVRPPARRAFTLVEIMVVMGVSSLVMGGLLAFFIQGLNIYRYDSGKLLVNRDIRALTIEMTDNATYANYFLIFPTFSDRSSTTGGVTSDTSVNDGSSGDMLVLVYKDPDDDTKVNRLVGYYRAPLDPADAASKGPVRKFDITISPSSSASVWTLLPAASTYNTNEEVIELSLGLATGKLFYNFFDRSVMVKGQIIHTGGMKNTSYGTATNTYNFTVSPRG